MQIQDYLRVMAASGMLGALLWLVLLPWRGRRRANKAVGANACREAVLLLFYMYLAGLLVLVLTPPGGWAGLGQVRGSVNLTLIKESLRLFRYYFRNGMWTALLVNFLGNIVMFMPVGFFAALLSDKPHWWKSTLWTAVLSLSIELAQLLVCRGTDVDDLILNTVGGLMGYWVYYALQKHASTFVMSCKTQ